MNSTPNRHHAFQVVINVHGGAPDSGQTPIDSSKTRLLSVDEALKYSPITSSAAFGLNAFPFPQLAEKSSLAPFTTLSQRQSLHQVLAPEPTYTPELYSHSTVQKYAAQQVSKLLEGGNLTEITFKTPQYLSRTLNNDDKTSPQQNDSYQNMSPVAKMILDSTNVPLNFSIPSTPDSSSKGSRSVTVPAKPPVSPSSFASANQQAYANNVMITPERKPPQSNFTKTPIVLVPSLPTSSQQEYITVTESAKRGISDQPDDNALTFAKRDEICANLTRLQDLLGEIFEAEDQLEPDTSHAAQPRTSAWFEFLAVFDTETHFLATKAHNNLQKALKKLVVSSGLHDIPDDYILRLQKICEPSIFAFRDLDFRIESLVGDDQIWAQTLQAIENGLSSSCTLLWTVLGSITKKELCPEDVVQCLPNILESTLEQCLIPIIEARPSGKDSEMFKVATAARGILNRIASQCRKLLDLITKLCLEMEGLGLVVVKLEMIASKLIFAENAHSEKDSALGFQVYEGIRRAAMDVLAKMFSRFKADRSDILAQLSQNLEKLPTTNKSARQFKLPDGKNIQLLSALLMLLVQATSLEDIQRPRRPNRKHAKAALSHDEAMDGDSSTSDDEETDDEKKAVALSPYDTMVRHVTILHDNAIQSASNIVKFFLDKATMPKSTKSGEEPYRNLLDMFVEDLLSVVASPDWPGSELLLRFLTWHMLQYMRNDKSSANVKNMALELLGWIGSAISSLNGSIQQMQQSSDGNDQSDLSQHLQDLAEDQIRGGLRLEDIVIQDGPFRIVAEYLQGRNVDNFQLTSARQFSLLQWGQAIRACFSREEDVPAELNEDLVELVTFVDEAIIDSRNLETNNEYDGVSPAQGRLAYLLMVTNSDFYKAFDRIVQTLIESLSSDQVKIRSRSIKSVITMIEADPKFLDRSPAMTRTIFGCATDSSPMVRDAALSFCGKYMTLKPDLEEYGCHVFLKCLTDATSGVRRRCMGLLKDIYQRSRNRERCCLIAEAFLRRVKDHEENVSISARQSIEEIWFTDLLLKANSGDDSARHKVAISERTTSIVATLQQNDDLVRFFEFFLGMFLSENTKSVAANFSVCKAIVTEIFLRVVEISFQAEKEERIALLRTLTAFATTKPGLITPGQLDTLQPYIDNVTTADDLLLFKSVVVIYRYTLPYLSIAQKPMLENIENQLLKNIPRLATPELSEVMACVWTINGVLKHTDRLARLAVSALSGAYRLRGTALPENALDASESQKTDANRIRTYLRIIGCVGKHFDLEDQPALFRKTFPSWQDNSVAGLMADIVCSFTSADRPLWLKGPALESLGSITQSWPSQFNKSLIRSTFHAVLDGQDSNLQSNVMTTLTEFFHIREDAKEVFSTQEDQSQGNDLGRLGGSLKASDYDSAASLIAQHYLQSILKIAMSRLDNCGLIAIKIIASINRQGLVHPKECAATLVALETSPVQEIARIAYESHKLLHHQHESMFEREYMRAIYGSFKYQIDVVGEPMGARTKPFAPKLGSLFELVQTSNAKYVRKFLGNFINRVNFDPVKLDTSQNMPEHLLYSRFIAQNLAYLEYARNEELLITISCIERIIGKTGADVAQAIDTDILGITTPSLIANGESKERQSMVQEYSVGNTDPSYLRRLTVAAMILSMLWEVRLHLKRQYNLDSDLRSREGKSKDSKELAKTPTKIHSVTGDRFWDNINGIMSSLDSWDTMRARCCAFAELMRIDDEVRVAADGDEMREHYSASLELDDEGAMPNGSKSKATKRKMSASASSTPKKKRGRSSLKDKRKSTSDIESDDAWD